MKFNMMIGGVETLFPEAEVCFFKETNDLVIYFLNLNEEILNKTKSNIETNQTSLRIEENYLVLTLKDLQYAYDLNKNKKIMNLYMNGASLGFAFEDENGNMLDIETPHFSHAI